MAQRAKPPARKAIPTTARPRGRPPGSISKKLKTATAAAGKATRSSPTHPAATPRKPVAASAPAIPKATKEELRVQVEKLERIVDTLRARSRDAVRAARQARHRIEELEAQLAAKEQEAPKAPLRAARAAPKSVQRAAAEPAAKPPRGRRHSVERDPGDAVPPGVAVEQPEPMDQEAAAAFKSLDGKLHPADK